MVNQSSLAGLNKQQITLEMPSEFGCEKMAMKLAVTIARQMGFAAERVEDLETAIAEACLNAIEHGNQMRAEARVTVLFSIWPDRLVIDVQDEGLGGPPPDNVPEPDIVSKMTGLEEARRLGLFLIKHLVDQADFVSSLAHNGNQFRMILYLTNKSAAV